MLEAGVQEALDFLGQVWGKGVGYVDLPSRVNGRWVPWVVEWPTNGYVGRRITSCVDDEEDLYFSVAKFSGPRRSADSVQATAWLWADLDEVTPESCGDRGFLPTVAWCTSPGRYQALWRLNKRLQPALQSRINRALTYAVGADHGGWDITQVLRLPGTVNWKHSSDGDAVELLWADGPRHDIRRLYQALTKTGAVLSASETSPAPLRSSLSASGNGSPSLLSLPVRARRLLQAKEAVVGERSARLWELECLLAEAGLGEEAAFELVWGSVWADKWRQRTDGERQCRQEIQRAYMSVDKKRHLQVVQAPDDDAGHEDTHDDVIARREVSDTPRLPWESYGDFLSRNFDAPRWLIEDIWTAHSHGIVGGEPKTSKTTLMLAMAVSVASGQPFLGRYHVGVQGPVLMVQEENAPWVMQDRLRKVAASYGLIRATTKAVKETGRLGQREVTQLDFPDDLPLRLLNNYGFDLSEEEHRELLEASVAELRPALVVIDPLYLVVGSASTDSGTEMRPFLKWLLYLRYEYNCAVAVVHHMSKYAETHKNRRRGQRLAGTHIFHGWLDCGLYTELREGSVDNTLKLRVDREFRSVGPRTPWDVDLVVGDPGDITFEVRDAESGTAVRSPLYDLVSAAGDRGLVLKDAADLMKVDKRTAKSRISRMDGYRLEQGRGPSRQTWRIFLDRD